MLKELYKTINGQFFHGDSTKILDDFPQLKNNVQLILTSPPFPLNNKKKYGNLQGENYKKWFVNLAKIYSDLLKDDGSIIIELGNAWEPNRPIQSLLTLESLLEFVKNPEANLRLCQEFVCYNPARLPSPAQWVTVNRIRTIDSFTHVWWMSKTDYPKADNRKILCPYSKSMQKLLERKTYNSGKRPSEHNISLTSFFKDNGGSIMHNVIERGPIDENRNARLPKHVLSMANTSSNDFYSKICREKKIQAHPARMQPELAQLFIEFLTDPGDIVLDPFAGSNTTGYMAEKLSRRWISIEAKKEYGMHSMIRFEDPSLDVKIQTSEGIIDGGD